MKSKSDFFKYIKTSSKQITAYITEHIVGDEYWLNQLGVSISNDEVEDIIKSKLNDLSNNQVIGSLLKYIFTDYLIDDDNFPIFSHYVSCDSYTSKRALFVYQCSNQYFCYYFGEELEVIVTENPMNFCIESMKDTIDYFDLEQENIKDNYFTDSSNELHWNFRLDLI